MRPVLLFLSMLIFAAASVQAQAQAVAPTVVISDTSKASWGPSPDDGKTFGTPPVAVLTNYVAEVWLKSAMPTFNAAGVPSVPAVFTFNFGKPAPVAGADLSPVLKPLIQPNTEYVLFLSAVGPGGTSPRTPASAPLGFPSAPGGVGAAVTFTP